MSMRSFHFRIYCNEYIKKEDLEKILKIYYNIERVTVEKLDPESKKSKYTFITEEKKSFNKEEKKGMWMGLPVIFKKKKKVNKEPEDFSYTKGNSTKWRKSDPYCVKCNSVITHEEYMTEICRRCGSEGPFLKNRKYRRIFIDGAWWYQYKYSNKEETELRKMRYNGDI